MKNLSDLLSEAKNDNVVNIVILECGAMNDSGNLAAVKNVIKSFKSVSLYGYNMKEGIHPVESINDFDFSGGHPNFDDLNDFYKKHLGELTIFVGV